MKKQISNVRPKRSYFPVFLFAVGLVCVLALCTDRDLFLDLEEGKVDIKSRQVTGLTAPAPPIDWRDRYRVLSERYDELKREFDELKSKTIPIAYLPEGLGSGPEDVILEIRHLWDYCQTIWYCCQVISTELAQRLSIDTNSPPDDAHMKTTFECLQICLRAIGAYSGQIDGNWQTTNSSVLRFQREKGLVADGKVGRSTWIAMLIDLTKQAYEEPPGKQIAARQ